MYRLLGLARRAGAIAPGTDAVRRAIRQGDARVVLMASDASQTQLDKIETTMHDRPVPRAHLGDRAALGAAVGRAPLSAVAVTNDSLAEQVLAELSALEAEGAPLGAEG